ncbi:hypothetical protein BCR33DRAFT_745347 [Rhizoclosmatium globosum]|uniref:Glycosyltransferase 61 catalytic domain-containing protein n=1 Tax=Rhizoclosmatium globosum TaxID=329046 RepID=A0A1Y2B570_9FUNG|nr:hypothetical protein BCR33DRAFT_745347 [Rhizoclosmatium globosum]|eukprot:ORY29245.1 hypothetical protein BCR33DRAFT_745347 [Rhizoclosmatium globosum]
MPGRSFIHCISPVPFRKGKVLASVTSGDDLDAPSWLPLPSSNTVVDTELEKQVRRLYKIGSQRSLENAERQAKSTIVVTYALRQAQTSHGPLSDTTMFGEQYQGASGNSTSPPYQSISGKEPELKRKVENEASLINRIRNFVDSFPSSNTTWKTENSLKIKFRSVDFATLSFSDQIAVAHGTDLFIGPHGAVFAYLLYLRKLPLAGVLELKPPERGMTNQQFHNLALRMGHRYEYASIGKSVSDDQMGDILGKVELLLEAIAKSRNHFQ